MKNAPGNVKQQHTVLSAVCGLYCPACTIYIGTHEDPERLQQTARRFGRPVEDLLCNGCRSDKRMFHCEEGCTFVACATEKGVEFCGECSEYPCEELKAFQAARPHRMDLWQDQQRIREIGCEQWFRGKAARYTCSECGTINSAYDFICRKCGTEPSCEYVKDHRGQIEAQLEKARLKS